VESAAVMAEGYTNKQIGDLLLNSKKTLKTPWQNILEKTNSKNTACFIIYTTCHHLLD
jgi:DNA-binding NarL/FixJ family response regulator